MTHQVTQQAWIAGDVCHVPDMPVHELILSRARRHPDAVAVRQWSKRLTYQQLAKSAAGLAQDLITCCPRPASRVGICMRRTTYLPVAILAVLAAGGTFVPLDPDQPAPRLRNIIDDAGIEVALVDLHGEQLLAGAVGHLIRADCEVNTAQDAGSARPVDPRDAAYVMYTSGSTGKPKGVIVSHRNLAAFAAAANQSLGGVTSYRQAAFAAIGFDVSIFEIFAPLVCGASIQLVSEAERADCDLLQRFLEIHRTTRVFLPPVLMPLLNPDRLPNLTEVIVGGEACDPGQVERWAVRGQRKFFNWYGPTESTVAVVGTELDGSWDRPLPIGRPLPGSRIYIADEDMALCPAGTVGQLYVGGPQVALGYVSGLQETAERFVPNPFGQAGTAAEADILYRTGDLASWDEAGVISFHGRSDRQVKIRGQRVEPGEIEIVLAGHPQVDQAVVDVSESVIRAYVTPGDAPSAAELRAYCANLLPSHMLPASITALNRLPLTVNAKIDFAALRRSNNIGVAQQASRSEPKNEIENIVADEWTALFGIARPDRDADFFLAGGDSLTAMRLASSLRRSTGKQIEVGEIFSGRTVAGIAARLADAEVLTSNEPPVRSAAALSSAQRRMWFVEQLAPGTPVHNIMLAEHVTGALDRAALTTAFERLAMNQAVLRWRLRHGDGLPIVTVADAPVVTVTFDDLSDLDAQARQSRLSGILDGEALTPIALTGEALWRVRLVRLAAAEHVLVITLHHIIFDGWSQDVLYRELGDLYGRILAAEPARPASQEVRTFADYSAWTAGEEARNGSVDTTWWQQHLAGAPTVLDLPRDRHRPATLNFSGEKRGRQLDPALAASIKRLATASGTTIGAVMFAAFGVLISRLTGERDLIVGTPMADRRHAEFENLLGFFIRTLPLRLKVDDNATFTEHIRRSNTEFEAARRHADAPLERVVQAMGVARDPSRNPLFQVMFNIYNFAEARLELGRALGRSLQTSVPGSLVDLTFYVILRDDSIWLETVYNSNLYHAPRIDAMLQSYCHLVRSLADAPEEPVGVIDLRSPDCGLPDWQQVLSRDVPASPGLVEQFRAVARDDPRRLAVDGPDGALSYADLLRISENTATVLQARAVRCGDAVAVLAERSAVLPGVLLGVLSAGARWAILDSELPAQAISRRLLTINPRALIRACRSPVPPCAGPEVPVIDAGDCVQGTHTSAPAISREDYRGYLSFTSGTTGEPKAIAAREAPLVHFLNWYRGAFSLDRTARFAMLSNVAHDPLLRDMFTPLTCGGTLVVPGSGILRDPLRLLTWLNDQSITVAHVTPQVIRMIAAGHGNAPALGALRIVGVAGDQLTEADVSVVRTIAPHARLLNFYGTTETPQVQAFHEVREPERALTRDELGGRRAMPVPVGKGIDGTQLLVLNVRGRPAAVGELGEVVIRSLHLSSGYLDSRLDATAFAPLPGAGEGSIYRTGDLGRYAPSGAVTLAGRIDDQVKVRGFRVELGEVESALRAHPAVQEAAARLVDPESLHAYITPAGTVIPAPDILRYLRTMLPAYAVPSGISVLPALPRNGSGKVDRAMLPPPQQDAGTPAGRHDRPEGEFEQLLAAIWRDVLGLPRIAVNNSFFEIGGHSMAIIDVQTRLQRSLGYLVPIVDLFRFPTIRSLATHLASRSADSHLLDAESRGRLRLELARRRRPHAYRGDLDQ